MAISPPIDHPTRTVSSAPILSIISQITGKLFHGRGTFERRGKAVPSHINGHDPVMFGQNGNLPSPPDMGSPSPVNEYQVFTHSGGFIIDSPILYLNERHAISPLSRSHVPDLITSNENL